MSAAALLMRAIAAVAFCAACALVLAFASPAHAKLATDDWLAGAHLFSRHENAAAFKDGNRGAYVQHLRTGITAGIVRNSYGRTSAYLGHTWHTADGRFALTAGAITGYPDSPVSPLLIPSMRLPLTRNLAARLSYLPKPPRYGASSAVHLSVETTWGR
ncbi:MAG: hypothetical protein LW854_08735 [Rubrivivax sp.]|jgi:hypothetical protein|nr:hypothetical protein [Rubrivivax sp.]